MKAWVLLHGFLGSPASWRQVLADRRLRGVEVFCPLLPGHGPAPAPSSFAAAVDELAAEIGRRFPADAYAGGLGIAAYSLGARLALGLLAAFPGLFAAALLIGVAPGLAGEERAARLVADARLAAQLRRQGLAAFLADWRQLPLFASQARLPPAILAEQAAINSGHDAAALADALEALSPGRMPDYRPQLAAIATETTLLVGQEDEKFLAHAEEMRKIMPNARLEVVPGAGHNLVLEAPAAVAAALGELAERGS